VDIFRKRNTRRLRVLVRAAFDASRQRYGSPRIHEDLIEQGVHVRRKRVVRVMQEDGLRARLRKRFKSTTMNDSRSVKSEVADRFDSCGEATMELFDSSKCSITSGGGIRRSARSAQPLSNGGPLERRS
jgi:transposase InsO family protein